MEEGASFTESDLVPGEDDLREMVLDAAASSTDEAVSVVEEPVRPAWSWRRAGTVGEHHSTLRRATTMTFLSA